MSWDDWLGTPAKIAGFVSAVASIALAVWTWGRRVVRVFAIAHGFHLHFGGDPASTIRDLLEGLRDSATASSVKTKILAHHLNLGLYICDPDGKCTWANDVLCELFGRDSSEMEGYGWIESLDQRAAVYELWKHSVEHGLPYSTEYTILNHRTNKRIHASTRAFAAMADEKVICYVGYVVPIRYLEQGVINEAKPTGDTFHQRKMGRETGIRANEAPDSHD